MRTRTLVAVIASVAWLAVAGYILHRSPVPLADLKPNEWGAFLAGTFAPVAFFWLVVGYFQQGDELRLSTETHRLQADELKNSVEQQRALVEVSRQQVEAEREILARDLSCIYCGQVFADASRRGQRRSWEHIVNDATMISPANIALCCISCNASKGAKLLAVWMDSRYCTARGIDQDTIAPVARAALRCAAVRAAT